MTDEPMVERLERLEAAATPEPWEWGYRDDPDAPGSVYRWDHYSEDADGVRSGISRAIAMCPRYGREGWAAARDVLTAALHRLGAAAMDESGER